MLDIVEMGRKAGICGTMMTAKDRLNTAKSPTDRFNKPNQRSNKRICLSNSLNWHPNKPNRKNGSIQGAAVKRGIYVNYSQPLFEIASPFQ